MEPIYVGVDWHKRTSTWVAVDVDNNMVYERTWPCTKDGVLQAIESLPVAPECVELGIEPVCGWQWAIQICKEAGIGTHVANPTRLREIAQTGKKTDKRDAHTIAELLRVGYLPESYDAPEDIQILRRAVRQRQYFVRLSTRTKCRIHSMCTERGAHVTSDKPLHRAERLRISNDEAHADIAELYKTLDELDAHQIQAETCIIDRIAHTREYEILTSIPGIGCVTAAAIIAEVGDFSRFPSAKQLISYAGLHPRERSSGGKQHFGSMNKQSSGVLRSALIGAAMHVYNSKKSQNLYSHYYAAKHYRKKSALQARIVLAHKILTIAWHLVKYDTRYDDHAVQPAQSEMTS
jgi:transposase